MLIAQSTLYQLVSVLLTPTKKHHIDALHHAITFVICFHFIAYIITLTVGGTILIAMCMVLKMKRIRKRRRTSAETLENGEMSSPLDSSSVELFHVTYLKRD